MQIENNKSKTRYSMFKLVICFVFSSHQTIPATANGHINKNSFYHVVVYHVFVVYFTEYRPKLCKASQKCDKSRGKIKKTVVFRVAVTHQDKRSYIECLAR